MSKGSFLWACGLAWILLGLAPARADRFEESFPVDSQPHVDVDIIHGRVEVEGGPHDEVRVRAHGGEVEIDAERDVVNIRAPMTGFRPWNWGRPGVRLELQVPYGSDLSIRTLHGPIEVEDVDGVLDLHAASGRIEVDGSPREARLETLNASIDFRGDDSEVVARTLNGNVELRGVGREVEVTSMSGRIDVEGEDLERVHLESMAGNIDLDASLAEGARILSKTYSGRVRLRLPQDVSARFSIESFSGDVRSAFAGDWNPLRGQRLRTTIGGGDARIDIESFSGGVRIEDDDGEARERRRERREERREKRRERREARAEAALERAERARERSEEAQERFRERAEEERERAEEARRERAPGDDGRDEAGAAIAPDPWLEGVEAPATRDVP